MELNELQLTIQKKDTQQLDPGLLEQMIKQYPYCGILKMLEAKLYTSLDAKGTQQKQHMASLYAYDRALLKQWLIPQRPMLAPLNYTPQYQLDQPSKMAPEDPKEPAITPVPQGEAWHPNDGQPEVQDYDVQAYQELAEKQMATSYHSKSLNDLLGPKGMEPLPKQGDDSAKFVPIVETSFGTVSAWEATDIQDLSDVMGYVPPFEEGYNLMMQWQLDTTRPPRPDDMTPEEASKLVDKFLEQAPSNKNRLKADEAQSISTDLWQASVQEDLTPVTETMAHIFIRQGKVAKAIAIYQQLSLNNPEKSDYFATQIKNLE